MTSSTLRQPAGGRYVGARIKKHQGDLFLTGRAEFIADITLPGTAYLAILRSPHPHARLRGVDLTAARAAPRVLLALDGELAAQHTNPIPHFIDPSVFGGKSTEVRPLALEKVVYQGQPVAAVVAETPHDAEAALDAIRVDYEPLPVVIDAEAALAEEAPRIYESWGDNVVIRIPFVEGDVDTAFQQADFTLRETWRIQRYSTQPIEPRGYLAAWNGRTASLTFYGACQNPHPLRWVLAQALRLTEAQVRVVAPNVGGAFGLKMHGHPEEALAALASRLLDRPVKWIEDRRETLLIGGREQVHHVEVAFTRDGRIIGLRNQIIANVGALGAAPGWGMAFLTALAFPTGYKIPAQDVTVTVVTTNKGPWNASRGYGKEATNLVMERIIDRVARRLALDPAEVRRRNFISRHEFPYKTNSGLNIDSGDFHSALEKALAMIDYSGVRAEQARRRHSGHPASHYLGVGIAFELTPEAADIPGTLVGGFDTTTVRMDPSGKVTVLTGVTNPGSGNDTGIAQVVADELGLSIEDVTVVQGDTQICPYGFGNYSGRSMVVGGSSAALAARAVRAKLAQAAAALLGVAPDTIELADGVARVTDEPNRALPLAQVAYSVYTLAFAVPNLPDPPLEATQVYKPDNITHVPDAKGRIQPYPTYSSAVHAAVVEVDAETGTVALKRFGVVHDCGTMVNPTFVEGQMQGAVVMGVGAALSEEQVYDESGHLVTNRFKTYLMPRAGDVPPLEIEHQVTPSPFTLLGTKGAGEAGVGGAQAAIVNAVEDALAPLGVELSRLPLTPPNVLQQIEEARS